MKASAGQKPPIPLEQLRNRPTTAAVVEKVKKISAAVLLASDPTNSISTTTQPTPVEEARMKTSLPETNGTWGQENGTAFPQVIAGTIGVFITVMELAYNPIA